jgi:hypothetical protein
MLEDRFGSLRAVLLVAVALLASAALQRPLSADGPRSLVAHRPHELYVPALRAPAPTIARAHVEPGDGSNGARGAHPIAASAGVATLGASLPAAASMADRAGTAAIRRGALPFWRAPPLI